MHGVRDHLKLCVEGIDPTHDFPCLPTGFTIQNGVDDGGGAIQIEGSVGLILSHLILYNNQVLSPLNYDFCIVHRVPVCLGACQADHPLP